MIENNPYFYDKVDEHKELCFRDSVHGGYDGYISLGIKAPDLDKAKEYLRKENYIEFELISTYSQTVKKYNFEKLYICRIYTFRIPQNKK